MIYCWKGFEEATRNCYVRDAPKLVNSKAIGKYLDTHFLHFCLLGLLFPWMSSHILSLHSFTSIPREIYSKSKISGETRKTEKNKNKSKCLPQLKNSHIILLWLVIIFWWLNIKILVWRPLSLQSLSRPNLLVGFHVTGANIFERIRY